MRHGGCGTNQLAASRIAATASGTAAPPATGPASPIPPSEGSCCFMPTNLRRPGHSETSAVPLHEVREDPCRPGDHGLGEPLDQLLHLMRGEVPRMLVDAHPGNDPGLVQLGV